MADAWADALRDCALRSGTGITVLDGDAGSSRSWAELIADADRLAKEAAIRPGWRVGVFGETGMESIVRVLATWRAGACVVLLPLRPRGMSDGRFREETAARLRAARADRVWEGGLDLASAGGRPRSRTGMGRADRGDAVLIQFTSGTTARPSAIQVPGAVLAHHVRVIADTFPATPRDCVASWMPLYHDMCFVACFAVALVSGARLILRPGHQFAARPSLWLHDLAEHRATVTAAPSVALGMAARAVGRERRALPRPLDRLARIVVGSESVREPDVRAFESATASLGLDRLALCGAYGMTEAVVGVALGRRMAGIEFVTVADRGGRAGGPPIRTALLGPPLPGVEVAIGSEPHGEVRLRGPNIIGRAGRIDGHGWFRTGDVGALVGQDLAVLGRGDDMITLGGRMLPPQLVELAAEQVDGVRKGNTAAVHLPSDEPGDPGRVIVVVETRRSETKALTGQVRSAVTAAAGSLPLTVRCVAPGTIPKTTSGKLQRSWLRADLAAG